MIAFINTDGVLQVETNDSTEQYALRDWAMRWKKGETCARVRTGSEFIKSRQNGITAELIKYAELRFGL